jgi:transposase
MEHRMTQAAAQALGLSYRQVKRLMARFRRRGAAGLVSGTRELRAARLCSSHELVASILVS